MYMNKKIKRSGELIQNGIALTLPSAISQGINCYAYALGVTFPIERKIGSYHPGYFTGNSIINFSDIEKLKTAISEDIYASGREHRCIECSKNVSVENILLREDEYLIKLFCLKPSEDYKYGNFHVMRQDPISKKWFHKEGWYSQPGVVFQKYFSDGQVNEPILYYINDFKFEPVYYFVIKES